MGANSLVLPLTPEEKSLTGEDPTNNNNSKNSKLEPPADIEFASTDNGND